MTRTEMQKRIDKLSLPAQITSFLCSLVFFHFLHVATKGLLAALFTAFILAHLVRTRSAKNEATLNDRLEAGHPVPNITTARRITVAAHGLESAALGALLGYGTFATFNFYVGR